MCHVREFLLDPKGENHQTKSRYFGDCSGKPTEAITVNLDREGCGSEGQVLFAHHQHSGVWEAPKSARLWGRDKITNLWTESQQNANCSGWSKAWRVCWVGTMRFCIFLRWKSSFRGWNGFIKSFGEKINPTFTRWALCTLGRDQFLLSLQQLSLPSQSVTNWFRPPRNSLSLHNHSGLAGDLLPALFLCPVASCRRGSALLASSCACSPDSSVPTFTHLAALPRGRKTLLSLLFSSCRKRDNHHPFSCQPAVVTSHAVPTQKWANAAETPPVPRGCYEEP